MAPEPSSVFSGGKHSFRGDNYQASTFPPARRGNRKRPPRFHDEPHSQMIVRLKHQQPPEDLPGRCEVAELRTGGSPPLGRKTGEDWRIDQ